MLRTDEWHLQESAERLPFSGVKAIESVTQSLKIYFSRVGAEESVPKGKYVGVVRVRFILITRVMGLVHVRGDEYQPHNVIKIRVHSDIGMFKLCVEG